MEKTEKYYFEPSELPEKETLRHQLQMEWQDFIQTRTQTWKSLEIEALLVVGLVGADLKFNNVWVVSVLGVIFIVSSLSGILITKHHRDGQIRKFTHIDRLEEALGLHIKGLLDEVHPPPKFKWKDVFNFNVMNTPIFIIRMHVAILMFTSVYIVIRVPWYVSIIIGTGIIGWITLKKKKPTN